MRQAGIIAAGALYALEHNRDRLAADHANAKLLVEGINGIPGVSADPAGVETNLVYFDVDRPADQVAQSLAAKGVLVLALGKNRIRAVPNLMVTSGDISKAVEAIEAVMTNG